jgi:lipoprotein NlpD
MKRYIGVAVILCVAGCKTTPHSSPIVERSAKLENKEIVATPVVAGPGFYVVKKGDTLYRIALENGQSYRDIVTWNNLPNPNDIKVDQILRVAPPEGSGVIYSKRTEVKNERRSEPKVENKNEPKEVTKLENKVEEVAPKVVLEWVRPTEGKIIARFEEGKNKGIDIAGKSGQAIYSAATGRVMYAGSGIRGYGNLVIVKHSNELLSAYAHTKTIVVKEGESVTKGQKIAEMGDTDSDIVKLHFEIRRQGKPIDPLLFLPSE